MSYVAINVLTIPPGGGEWLEQRFAGRAGAVDRAPSDSTVRASEVVQCREGTAW